MLISFLSEGCSSNGKKLRGKFEKFKRDGSEENLENLLHAKADGEYLYLKNALVLRAMVESPQVFERLFSNENRGETYRVLLEIMENRKRYVQYYPEYFPSDFDEKFRKLYSKYLSN